MRRPPDHRPLAERFRDNVLTGDGCWEWTGLVSAYGYGRIHIHAAERSEWDGRSHMQAHRVAYVLAAGPIPDGLMVCHTCDNRRCVRLDHLFLGTATDNQRDMSRKGRARNGRERWTHCIHGHLLSDDNLVKRANRRTCKTCHRMASQRRRARPTDVMPCAA